MAEGLLEEFIRLVEYAAAHGELQFAAVRDVTTAILCSRAGTRHSDAPVLCSDDGSLRGDERSRSGVVPTVAIRQNRPMGAPATTGRVAFICAMPMELRPLVKKLSLRKSQLGGVSVHTGATAGHEVVAIVTGMGTELAARGTRRLLEAVSVDHVIVVGITGAVENLTPIGTLIRPEVVVDSATGSQYRPAPLGEGTPHGTMWTTDVLLTDTDAVNDLRARGVVSLDMETAAIAAVCEQRKLPWSVFRVISDRATDGSVDAEVFHLSNQDGSPNGPAIARYFIRHPGRIPQMARLARGARLATETAAKAAIRACTNT